MIRVNTFRRTILFGFFIATFIPLAVLGYISHSYMIHKLEESGNRLNELEAKKVAAETSMYLRNPEIALQQLSILLEKEDFSSDQVRHLLVNNVRESVLLDAICLIDTTKHIVNIGLDEGDGPGSLFIGRDIESLRFLRNIEYLPGIGWSNVMVSPFSGNKSIAAIIPVEEQGYLIGLVNLGVLHNSLTGEQNRESSILVLLDQIGESIVQSHPSIPVEGDNISQKKPFLEYLVGVYGTYQFMLNEVEHIGSTASVPGTKWLVMVAQPLSLARKSRQDVTQIFLGVGLVALFLIGGLSWRQSKKMLVPLETLQRKIQLVAQGDYEAEIATQKLEEFEEVAFHFRQMAAAVKGRQKLLELNEERLQSLLEIHNLKELKEEEILQFALRQSVVLTRSDLGCLYVMDSDEFLDSSLLWSSATGRLEGSDERVVDYHDRVDLWKKTLNSNEPVILAESKRVLDKQKSENRARELSVPVTLKSKRVALVTVVGKKKQYDETDARQLSLYFNHIWGIVQQKRVEQERGRLAEQLAQAQKLEAIGTLASGVAHDFNNVLMVIIGNTELARDNINDKEKLMLDLDEVFRASLRARDLVNQILAFSRHGAGRVKPLDIGPLVKEAVKVLRSSIGKDIEVRADISQDSQMVSAEPNQINQLIMNLCSNSCQAMEKRGGILRIQLIPETLEHDLYSRGKLVAVAGRYMLLNINDTGTGIPEEMIDRIFEPYFTTREKERGTGLGLAVVHGIIKGLKGAIIVESELGEGSTFKVYLPIAQQESRDVGSIVSGNLPGGNESILYVDDDEAVALINSKILENLGYHVSLYYNSYEALDAFNQDPQKYDLVICDMGMQEIPGDRLANKIMMIDRETPIILCTGYDEKIKKDRIGEIGVTDILMKPLTKFDLALTVRKVLGYKGERAD